MVAGAGRRALLWVPSPWRRARRSRRRALRGGRRPRSVARRLVRARSPVVGHPAGAAQARALGRARRRDRAAAPRRSAACGCPYVGADPWPALTLQLLGALLCVLAGAARLLAARARRAATSSSRSAGCSCSSSRRSCRSAARGRCCSAASLAALAVCFLWLERLPLRPGVGVAALLAIALAGAFPLAGVADREQPWFDYQAFAEGLGPDDPVRFDWSQRYGPIDWPRDAARSLRVAPTEPSYWKLRNLERVRRLRVARPAARDPAARTRRSTCPTTGAPHPEWTQHLPRHLPAPGGHRGRWARARSCGSSREHPRRPVGRRAGHVARARPSWARRLLHASDAYVPTPTARPARAPLGRPRRPTSSGSTMPIKPRRPGVAAAARSGGLPVREAQVRFRPFEPYGAPSAERRVPEVNRSGDGVEALRSSPYARTWRLAQRLRRGRGRRYDYVARGGRVPARTASATRSTRRPRGPAGAARRLPVRQPERLLPAVRRRDGAAAADGRRARAGGRRLLAGRLLEAQGRVDRARHGRARVGRGVVRPLRLGRARPDAAGRRPPAPRSRRSIPTRGAGSSLRRRSAREGATAQGASRGPQGGRAERPGAAAGRARGERRRPGAGTVALARAAGARRSHCRLSRRGGSRRARRRRGRTAAAGSTVRSPSSRRRSGAAAARRRPASRCISWSGGCAARRRRPPTCGAADRPLRPGPGAAVAADRRQRRALRRALAAGGGPAARLRALWALPAVAGLSLAAAGRVRRPGLAAHGG